MDERRKYEKPTVESRDITPGVYGNYSQGNDGAHAGSDNNFELHRHQE